MDDHSWGREAIDPGNHVLQVALNTACKTHGNITTVEVHNVGIETDTTSELVFQLPESLFSNSGRCG